ncbi:MAG: hypothetical protein M3N16_01870 [Actinomycetota bacterium]|nr:hypothetical protein [Actinomycetota bacterium]
MSLSISQRVAVLVKKPALAVAALAALGATLTWAPDSPAGSYQSPLQVTHVAKMVRVAADEVVDAEAECPRGSIATGGGLDYGVDEPLYVDASHASKDGRGWVARAGSTAEEGEETASFTVTAVCARGVLAGVRAGTARKRR